MNERAKYKLIGFIMMFCSSSLMGGIGAFTRFIDAPGDFVSFWRNFAGLIALTIIFLFIGGFKKVKATRFSGMMLLSGIFLGLLSGLSFGISQIAGMVVLLIVLALASATPAWLAAVPHGVDRIAGPIAAVTPRKAFNSRRRPAR